MALEIKEEALREAWVRTWIDPRSYATTLVHMFHDRYHDPKILARENCYTWHPKTIAREIKDDFRVELPRLNLDRLLMGIWLVTSDEFYRDLPSFIDACNVLGGGPFDPTMFDPADAAECAWGITEALLLAPPDEDDEAPFSEEILAYIGKILDQENIIHPPDILRLGTRSEGLAERIHGEFADEPELFSAIYQKEAQKSRDIDDFVRENLTELIMQLGALRLTQGDATGLLERLSQNRSV
jgi:hypothetical protein